MDRYLVIGWLAVFSASQAHAHVLQATATVEGDQVRIDAAYDTGESAANALVRVLDADGELIHRMRTDEEGKAVFDIDGEAGGVTIEIHDAEGHSDFWIVTPRDLEGG